MTRTQPMAFGVLPGRSHSGKPIGIIRRVTMANADTHPTAIRVLRCLQIKNSDGYNALSKELDKTTQETQEDEHKEAGKTLVL